MRRVRRWTSDKTNFERDPARRARIFLIFLLVFLGACVQTPTRTEKTGAISTPQQRVYFAEYEEVERAIKQAMVRYPQRIDNLEAGIFETDYVKGDARFKPPAFSEDYSSGYRYRILIRMVRGKAEKRAGIKVMVTKAIEMQRDFFADPENIASDGLEEMVILYRIQREISIEKALRKAQEKQNQKATAEES